MTNLETRMKEKMEKLIQQLPFPFRHSWYRQSTYITGRQYLALVHRAQQEIEAERWKARRNT